MYTTTTTKITKIFSPIVCHLLPITYHLPLHTTTTTIGKNSNFHIPTENSLLNGGKQLREEESQQYTERPLPVSLDDLETTNKLKQLREEFSELKSEYMRVVGGGRKDVPIYFGRVPDSFQ